MSAKEPCIPKKSPKSLENSRVHLQIQQEMFAKDPYIPAKEPCISAKEPCIPKKEPQIFLKQPYTINAYMHIDIHR